MNEFYEEMAAFVAMRRNKENSAAKELSITDINTKWAATNRQTGLPLNSVAYFCNCESNYHVATTIIFDCVSIPFSHIF